MRMLQYVYLSRLITNAADLETQVASLEEPSKPSQPSEKYSASFLESGENIIHNVSQKCTLKEQYLSQSMTSSSWDKATLFLSISAKLFKFDWLLWLEYRAARPRQTISFFAIKTIFAPTFLSPFHLCLALAYQGVKFYQDQKDQLWQILYKVWRTFKHTKILRTIFRWQVISQLLLTPYTFMNQLTLDTLRRAQKSANGLVRGAKERRRQKKSTQLLKSGIPRPCKELRFLPIQNYPLDGLILFAIQVQPSLLFNLKVTLKYLQCVQVLLMQRTKQTTDIDRKLAIYYHPLFQQVIKNILLLFKLPANQNFEIGLIEFVEFNLKLQKTLLPSFQLENALVSGLNDWVKEVAECLSYEGMVSTSSCQQITNQNFSRLLEKQLNSIHVQPFTNRQQYLRILLRMNTHDAFKLLGVKINKEVFNKFMFDLCSTWCEFLDIQLFSYFLIAIYVQLSEGTTLAESSFRKTSIIKPIDLQFMEEFEQIKAIYSKNRKKDLRYYRAWCQWNYLRINQIGQSLILQLDQIHENDPRILQLALIFERSIQVINQEITNQNVQPQPLKPSLQSKETQKEAQFLIAKKIDIPIDKERRSQRMSEAMRESTKEEEPYQPQEEINHRFQIQIDAEGNMFLRKIVRLPVFGIKIDPQPAERKEIVKFRYLQRKKEEIRQISNLYKRMENMKIRLEHNVKNDPYNYKQQSKIADRDEFYQKQEAPKSKNMYTNVPIDKIIHSKIQPQLIQPTIQPSEYKNNFKAELIEEKEPIRKNQDYIHKVMAPSFVTDQNNNVSFGKGEGAIYGVGPYAQRRDLKIGLPKLKHIDRKIQEIGSYHLIGKLTKDRSIINQRVKSFSTTEQFANRLSRQKEEYKHVWTRYISEEQINELNNYKDFYSKLQQAKKKFAKDYQSAYRTNLKQILLYDNKRYEMGGIIDRKQEQQFYQRIRKLIKRDVKRQQRKKRKTRLRQYRKAVGGKEKRKLFENIFISYHRTVIRDIKEQRSNASMAK